MKKAKQARVIRRITHVTVGHIQRYEVIQTKKKQYELRSDGSAYALAGLEFAQQEAQRLTTQWLTRRLIIGFLWNAINGGYRYKLPITAARQPAQPVKPSAPVAWRLTPTRGALLFTNGGTTLAEHVETAAENYRKKYGDAATKCRVNPALLPEGTVKIDDIEVTASASVLPGRIWIGGGA